MPRSLTEPAPLATSHHMLASGSERTAQIASLIPHHLEDDSSISPETPSSASGTPERRGSSSRCERLAPSRPTRSNRSHPLGPLRRNLFNPYPSPSYSMYDEPGEKPRSTGSRKRRRASFCVLIPPHPLCTSPFLPHHRHQYSNYRIFLASKRMRSGETSAWVVSQRVAEQTAMPPPHSAVFKACPGFGFADEDSKPLVGCYYEYLTLHYRAFCPAQLLRPSLKSADHQLETLPASPTPQRGWKHLRRTLHFTCLGR